MGFFDFLKKNKNSKPSVSSPTEPTSIPGYSVANRLDFDTNTIEAVKHRFIAFDVETTGLSPEFDRIVEIGAVLFVDGKRANCFSTLVNPGVPISASASSVNHITNGMLANAPREDAAYKEFVRFLGDAMSGKTYMCAHNARFDFDFLCNTLSRLGYNARLKYFDTLSLSRRLIKGLENYKQGTLERYFCLTNKATHRADSDAEACGDILCRLVCLAEKAIEEEKAQFEKNIPSDDELEVCAVIQRILTSAGEDTSWLGFRKNSGGYVDASCLYTFLKFKFTKKGKYIILKNEAGATDAGLPCEPCTSAEGGTENIRVYFSRPTDIEPYGKLITQAYQTAHQSLQDYIRNGIIAKREVNEWLNSIVTLSDDDTKKLIATSEQKEYTSTESIVIEPIITRDMVVVSAVHNRCPLSQIKNLGDWEKGFDEGFKYYECAEEARKAGRFEEALALYDKARFNGYEAPALYNGYAMTYHKMRDYDNEIVIIEEFLTRETHGKAGQFEARRSAAIKALYSKQESERKARDKALEKERKKKEEEEKTQPKEKTQRGRAICQLDDNDNIIAEFKSLSQAVEAVGVSSKSIRDAANGVQKHAGGFCWKYKDQFTQNSD